jgi:hypothetical protein
MAAFKIVQKIPSLTVANAAGISTSAPIALKSGYLRISPTQNTYIELDSSSGIDTNKSFWISGGSEAIFKESVRSQPVVGITTGTTTIISFAPGTSASFSVGDFVELTGIEPIGINTNYAQVLSVDNDRSYDSSHGSRLVLNLNTSSQSSPTKQSGELRKVIKLSAYNAGASSNKIHITEVQVVSNFS